MKHGFLAAFVLLAGCSGMVATPVALDSGGQGVKILQSATPACQDKGVVESKEGDVVGILMEYINKTLPNLADALSKDDVIEKSRRAKWATQIEDTLKQLHTIGVVWGDAKTSNILIHEKDDAWIVDFGGGQTLGWVDYELVGSKDGDLQALKEILAALHV